MTTDKLIVSNKADMANFGHNCEETCTDLSKNLDKFTSFKRNDSGILPDLLRSFSQSPNLSLGDEDLDSGIVTKNCGSAALLSEYRSLIDSMNLCDINRSGEKLMDDKANSKSKNCDSKYENNLKIIKNGKTQNNEDILKDLIDKSNKKTSQIGLKTSKKDVESNENVKIVGTDKMKDGKKVKSSLSMMLSANNLSNPVSKKIDVEKELNVKLKELSIRNKKTGIVSDEYVKNDTKLKVRSQAKDKVSDIEWLNAKIDGLKISKNAFEDGSRKDCGGLNKVDDGKVDRRKSSKDGSKEKTKNKEKVVFLERGPVRCKTSDVNSKILPYERHQVHRNSFSGGKVLMASNSSFESGNILIPISVKKIPPLRPFPEYVDDKLTESDSNLPLEDPFDEVNAEVNAISEQLKRDVDEHFGDCKSSEGARSSCSSDDFTNWDEDLNIIMEVLEGDGYQTPRQQSFDSCSSRSVSTESENENNAKKCEFQNVKLDLKNLSDFISNNVVENTQKCQNFNEIPLYDASFIVPGYQDFSGSFTDQSWCSSSPLTIAMDSPNQLQDSWVASSSLNNSLSQSPNGYQTNNGSPMQQVFSSPYNDTTEIFDNNLLYERAIPSVSADSFSSNSPLESPNFKINDDLEIVSNALTNEFLQSQIFDNLTFTSEANCMRNNADEMHVKINQNDAIKIQNSLYSKQDDDFKTSNNFGVSNDQKRPVFVNGNNVLLRSNYVGQVDRNVKLVKRKPVALASRDSLPCCINYSKSANEVMEEMFERLDLSMKKKLALIVHNLSEDVLLRFFDGQLSSWKENARVPRLPLLHVVCQRLLMQPSTATKFLQVYSNGLTLIDRAVHTCWQTPLVARYLAECALQAGPLLARDNNKEFILDKPDQFGSGVLHRAVARGAESAASLAGLLSLTHQGKPAFNVDKVNSDGYTPLHMACSRHGSPVEGTDCACHLVSHVLLRHGKADPNIKDGKSGNTALHAAVDSGSCAPGLVSLLLQHGAKPNIKNYSGNTAQDLARTASRSASRPQYPKRVLEILKKYK